MVVLGTSHTGVVRTSSRRYRCSFGRGTCPQCLDVSAHQCVSVDGGGGGARATRCGGRRRGLQQRPRRNGRWRCRLSQNSAAPGQVLARGRVVSNASRPLRGAAIRAADDAVPRRVAQEIRPDLGKNSDVSRQRRLPKRERRLEPLSSKERLSVTHYTDAITQTQRFSRTPARCPKSRRRSD